MPPSPTNPPPLSPSTSTSSFASFHSAVSSPDVPAPDPPPSRRTSKLAPSRALRFLHKVSSASSAPSTPPTSPPQRRPRTPADRPSWTRRSVDPDVARSIRTLPHTTSDRSSTESPVSSLRQPLSRPVALSPVALGPGGVLSPASSSRIRREGKESVVGSTVLLPGGAAASHVATRWSASPGPSPRSSSANVSARQSGDLEAGSEEEEGSEGGDGEWNGDEWGGNEWDGDEWESGMGKVSPQNSAPEIGSSHGMSVVRLTSSPVALPASMRLGADRDESKPLRGVGRRADSEGAPQLLSGGDSNAERESDEGDRPTHLRDEITLRAFDEKGEQNAKIVASDLARVSNLTGMYADPMETDDWGDDFVLEQSSSRQGSSESRTGDEGSASFPSWFIEKDPSRSDFEFKPDASETVLGGIGLRTNAIYYTATAEILPGGDDSLPLRSVPSSAFTTPILTHASLLTYPGIGYETSEVHPSCTRVKELFSRYGATIRRHFDALVRDSRGTKAFGEGTTSVYYLVGDDDVDRLAAGNKEFSADVLLWKLEWASLDNKPEDQAHLLLSLSAIAKEAGNFHEARRLVGEGLKAVADAEETNYTVALAAELECEYAILCRAIGSPELAAIALKRAIVQATELASRLEEEGDLRGPQQRGLRWQLRCKFLLAEVSYDMGNLEDAVQFFSEFVVESLTRMIGLISPPRPEDTPLGPEFMRYCLFTPRRLVLAMWTTVLSLGQMRCYAAAADAAGLTCLVASSFGYEDANNAATAVRSQIKDISNLLRQQYEDISSSISQGSEAVTKVSTLNGFSRPISVSQFDYNVGNFGDMGDNVVEDWDTQLEKELDIKIARCCDNDQLGESSASQQESIAPSPLTNEAFAVPLQAHTVQDGKDLSKEEHGDSRRPQQAAFQWDTDQQHGNFIEAELSQYLGRVVGAASTFSAQQMFPKPTQPFDGRGMGPREHENFLRRFVRSKDPVSATRILHGLSVSKLWHPSSVCNLNNATNPVSDFDLFSVNHDVLSPVWSLKLLDTVWKVIRSNVELRSKRTTLRQFVPSSFSKLAKFAGRTAAHKEKERVERLGLLGSLLESLRLAREILSTNGSEAIWFSRSCFFLGLAAATMTPTAKAAVELFQAESRAHCGVRAVVSDVVLERCSRIFPGRGNEIQEKSGLVNEIASSTSSADVPAELRQSVVDVMHALYWRTKAGYDESVKIDSLEKLLHADVASSLYLTGAGISPVDGSAIDFTSEKSLLHIRETTNADSDASSEVVDETRRVSSSELIAELNSLWSSLPTSSGLVRAKVSFALAHYDRVEKRRNLSAERFLFDALRSVHAAETDHGYPYSFFTRQLSISPVSLVSSPFAEGILQAYGKITLSHSKYRYGIAALEAASDGRRVRKMNMQIYRSALGNVIECAVENNDWKRAMALLYNLRSFVHPKDGLRNEFLHICLQLHRLCFDVGCFEASVVPLRAYSALIFEERLRLLLQRYRRRLAKKARKRMRRRIPGSPLPKVLAGTSVFPKGRNSLASFFETPLVNAAFDGTIRQSVSLFDKRTRSPTALVPVSLMDPGSSPLRRLTALLWPVSVKPRQPASSGRPSKAYDFGETNFKSISEDVPSIAKPNAPVTDMKTGGGVLSKTFQADAGQFVEEQRELLRIEAEQEITADSDRFAVELLQAQTEYAQADFPAAERRCRGLLEMRIPHAARYKIFEILSRIRLKRRELTRCFELIDQMEIEYFHAQMEKEPADPNQRPSSHENQRVAMLFRHHEAPGNRKDDDKRASLAPEVTFLRLVALIHAGRLNEALYLADSAIEQCENHSFWDQGRLHYLRGKALYSMSCASTPPFQRENDVSHNSQQSTQLNLKVTELALAAFETSSRFYDGTGDEISTAKSDARWARTCIDFLFRSVVLNGDCGGGMSLKEACNSLERPIVMQDVLDVVYSVLRTAMTANLPLLLIDAMAALAEVKCIQQLSSNSWSFWVSEAWKLFSRLFADAEDFTVVLNSLAPVSTLFRLRNLCGRLVRLVMCDGHVCNSSDMNRHLRLFEAYVTLQMSIDRKMNLASSAHHDPTSLLPEDAETTADGLRPESYPSGSADSQASIASKRKGTSRPFGSRKLAKTLASFDKKRTSDNDLKSERLSDSTSDKSAPRRPGGMFLHILGDEGVALGRQGISVFINRPRQQVMSAVRGTGAVLIPTNFFSNSKSAPGNIFGGDAEMIFPFKPSVGLGAMRILDNDAHIFEKSSGCKQNSVNELREVSEMNSTARCPDVEGASESHHESMENTEGALPRTVQASASENIDSERSNDRLSDRLTKSLDPLSNKLPTSQGRQETTTESRNDLVMLLESIREELSGGNIQTKGSSRVFGKGVGERVWAHMHRVKIETKRYMHGEISMRQLQERNNDALLGWVHCIPLSRTEWTVPESIGRRLVYTLYAHGVVGYYSVERGGSIARVAFGGKLVGNGSNSNELSPKKTAGAQGRNNGTLRSPTDSECLYLYELVKAFKRDGAWYKNRDSQIIDGLANRVLRAPRLLLSSSSPDQRSRSRPIVLIADLSLQILPWELFFDHVVIRSHSLLDIIRGLQDQVSPSMNSSVGIEDPAVAAARKLARFISFGPLRREVVDLERTEEARRQQLAFQSLLGLNHMHPSSLISCLGTGGFSDPMALNAVPRPTGPLSSPLSQSRKAVKLFGLRISANIGRRNYPHMDFLKVSGLGSATTWDLKEAAMVLEPSLSDTLEPRRDLGAYVPVFMFSYADLVDSSDSVFGLRRAVQNGILMFTPAIHMKVLARHLEDDELSTELARASGRMYNRIFPDVVASARVLVEYVSRFSREKRIPIVIFLGQGLVGVFPREHTRKVGKSRAGVSASDRLTPLHGGGREYYRRVDLV